jgi:hypothetical protein
MAPDIQQCGIDRLAPMWHFMDLTPQGRGNWYASLAYGTNVQAAWADGVELVLGEAAEVFFAEAAVTEQSGEDDGQDRVAEIEAAIDM